MALTGMDVLKLLPKTNCRECGLPTCIAFAMSLITGRIDLSACPYASDELKAKLSETEAGQLKIITIGNGEKPFQTGCESKLFRHEKGFEHPTGLALLVTDTMDSAEVDSRLRRFQELRYRRMGLVLSPELVAVKHQSKGVNRFIELIEKVDRDSDGKLILMSESPTVVASALERFADKKPLIYAANSENLHKMAELAVKYDCPVTAKANSLDELLELSDGLKNEGVEKIVLDPADRNIHNSLANHVYLRRAAVYKESLPLSFPTIAFPCEMAENLAMETLIASMFIAKYAGIIVLSDFQAESLYPLLLERMELFSDPEEPLMVPADIYAVNNPDRNSPILLASSWALTYYNLTLAAEVANTPVFLCFGEIKEPDVLCWCRHCIRSTHKGTFDAEGTAQFIRKCKLDERVDHRKLVVCSRNAVLRAELEKALPEWEVVIGPDKADQLHGFLPGFAKELAQQCGAI